VETLMLVRSILVLSLALGVNVGCSKEEKGPGATAPAKTDKPTTDKSTTTPQHAPADVKPGSHEDWCAEHEVPESQCTRCNPDLIPAFKATNDWCPEHGLPESQCKICNPEIVITRPAKAP
jgi:hypothetical protein